MPRTINARNRKFTAPPFHAEYIHSDLPFRNFRFRQLISAQRRHVLNSKQKAAVEMALKCPVSLIQGPPGTGKTQTAAAIVANLAQDPEGKILCCAPSNVAIDNLTLKIAALGGDLKILRLVAHTRDINNLDPGVVRYTVMEEFKRRMKKGGKKRDVCDSELRRFEKDLVQERQIICCTCNSAGLFALEKVHFPYVLIDEAAQGMEPDCLVAITRACEKLVLVGDPAQLGACIKFPNLQGSQLAKSLFERLWKKCPWIMLSQQYRMHPEIRRMVSELTYEDGLEDDLSVVQRRSASIFLDKIFLPPAKPMLFVDVVRNDELSGSGTSYVNVMEAHFIARLVANILHEGDVFHNGPTPAPEHLGVITFYNGQRPHMETQLRHHTRINKRVERIEINSVDGFQGREKEIIILSCVRSGGEFAGRKSLGFTDDKQRLNVAMSRAKRALIVVGNSEIFHNSTTWRQYFRYIPVTDVSTVCERLAIACSCRRLPCKICPDVPVRRT